VRAYGLREVHDLQRIRQAPRVGVQVQDAQRGRRRGRGGGRSTVFVVIVVAFGVLVLPETALESQLAGVEHAELGHFEVPRRRELAQLPRVVGG
jgi:hypothetical protein